MKTKSVWSDDIKFNSLGRAQTRTMWHCILKQIYNAVKYAKREGVQFD